MSESHTTIRDRHIGVLAARNAARDDLGLRGRKAVILRGNEGGPPNARIIATTIGDPSMVYLLPDIGGEIEVVKMKDVAIMEPENH